MESPEKHPEPAHAMPHPAAHTANPGPHVTHNAGHDAGHNAAQPAHHAEASKSPAKSADTTSLNNLRRTPATVDPLGRSAQGLDSSLNAFRLAAASKVFGGLQQIQQHANAILQTLQQPKLPPNLIGVLLQPSGAPAARLQVEFKPSSAGGQGPTVIVFTGADGSFNLNIPAGLAVPQAGLKLTVHGAHNKTTVEIDASRIAANGMIGVVTLSLDLWPLPVSIIAALQAATGCASAPAPNPCPPSKNKHKVNIGEQGSVCVQTFDAGDRVDRFPWGIFFRVVEPQMSIATQAHEIPVGKEKYSWLPVYSTESKSAKASKYVDRVPVDQPLSVDGFRDQIAGIDNSGKFAQDETVPMAASLGLGYVLRMSQQWTLQGLGLGDLVYSLPLAPGEQQQMAVFERQDTTAVQESEFFSQSEVMNQQAMTDTSAAATFNSAFNEMVNGSSAFSTDSTSSSFGGSFLGIGGGSGSSSSKGTSSTSLSGSRDTAAQAIQATHSSAENSAAARLNANRTGMRLATASENMGVTTKIITNHNHNHSLTMQYWEVQRVYDVTTTIDGVTLVCLIPMQIVRFMPPGQPATLDDPSTVDSHEKVLKRYRNILSHLDVLHRVVPRRFHHGLNLLAQFAADPTTVVDSSGTSAETVIQFKLSGNFVICDRISVVAVTRRNTRVGPVQLAPAVAGQPASIPQNKFTARDEIVAWLTGQRQVAITELQGSLALPPSINRSDIIGFEISRHFLTVRQTLMSAAQQAAEQYLSSDPHGSQIVSDFASFLNIAPLQTITLGPGDLEPLLGGPTVNSFYAAVENFDASGKESKEGKEGNESKDKPSPQETYANDSLTGTVLPPQPFPVPALQLAPVLRYQDILEIEKAAQHVVRNTTRYSRALWLSMTPEECAILLDGYTIGVPPGGLGDASQMIPLLNCLQNKVLGTFGNSLVMPFTIPQDLAEQTGIDPAQIQQALLDYQRESFVAPHSTIALPTRGVLGEAVLGHCPSSEKIDLTRFWNWQDAPADTAPGIGMVQLPTTTPPLTTGVTAPNSLTNLPPLINNLIAPPQPNTSLLQAMGQQATSQPDFSPTLTGQQQLAGVLQNSQTLANSARSDALKASLTSSAQAMSLISGLVGSAMGSQAAGQPAAGAPAAKSTAATAAKGAAANTAKGAATPAAGAGATPAASGGTAAAGGAAAAPSASGAGSALSTLGEAAVL